MKKKYIAMMLVVALAFSMIGVGTMAWFTSTATSANNTFVAGTLTLGGIIDGEDVANRFATLNLSNIKPGEPRDLGTTELKNVGSLSFKLYRITASNFTGDLNFTDTLGRKMDDVLNLIVTIGGERVYEGKFSQLVWENGGFFDPIVDVPVGDVRTMQLSVLMDESAGNDFQGKNFKCDLTVYATQNEVPENGEPIGTEVYLGRTSGAGTTIPWDPAFSVVGKNDNTYVNFDWDWEPNDDVGSGIFRAGFEHYQIDIKHEKGSPDNTIDAEQTIIIIPVDREIDVTGDGPLTESDIVVDWSGDVVKIKKAKLLNAGWDGFEVRLSGIQLVDGTVRTILADGSEYQYWSLLPTAN
ncbi:TasA family protein [Lutispora saccharofermentans]|uniref:CalY family protein n=1 Tax=Lutispora saccharofermentans TaxID=3024236 RepID=A0ABT1NBK3_9FIRM|nr:TasA family protein [Lutispora saccharofermentans]MCQ1528645.1 CalY family protein [Lutispora saccharofermentans]